MTMEMEMEMEREIGRLASPDCTGCGACMAVCPKDCIRMERNPDGFDEPVIDLSACVGCGACDRVCCAQKDEVPGVADGGQYAQAAVTRDEAVWLQSSSGGAFSEICHAVQDMAGDAPVLISGAVMEGARVFHLCVRGISRIGPLRRSKYVQSATGDCFREIRDALQRGEYVVFSGTPCQVAGLRAFLGRPFERLLSIDLICHGVGSPGVFEAFLMAMGNRYGQKVIAYDFRFKRVRWGAFERYASRHTLENGTRKLVRFDGYNRLFLNQACLRASCSGRCKYRSQNRQGDITLADFNAKTLLLPHVRDFRNYSTIVYNSAAGRRLAPRIEYRMDVYACDLEHICEHNPLFCETTPPNLQRDAFFNAFRSGEAMESLVKTFGMAPPSGLNAIAGRMPYGLKRAMYCMAGVMKNVKK